MDDFEDKQVRLSVYVSDDKRARFKATCAIKKISMNQVISDFLDEWLAENDPMREKTLPSGSAKGSGGKGRGKEGGKE